MIADIKKLFKTDRILFLSIILTLPALVIWIMSLLSFIWINISDLLFNKTTSRGQLLLLVIAPFCALLLALFNYLKSKENSAKIIFILNLILILVFIISSILI